MDGSSYELADLRHAMQASDQSMNQAIACASETVLLHVAVDRFAVVSERLASMLG